MNDIDALYRATVLDHYRNPRNRRPLPDADGSALVHNPVCGDQVRVEVKRDAGRLASLSAIARGCSIAVASASVMTEWARGRSPGEVPAAYAALRELVEKGEAVEDLPGSMRAFAPVARWPARRRCALLAWEALLEALGEPADQRIV